MLLPCGEDATVGNLSRQDHPRIENFTRRSSHNIPLPRILSAPAVPQPPKSADNLVAVLLPEPAPPNPLLNTESI